MDAMKIKWMVIIDNNAKINRKKNKDGKQWAYNIFYNYLYYLCTVFNVKILSLDRLLDQATKCKFLVRN